MLFRSHFAAAEGLADAVGLADQVAIHQGHLEGRHAFGADSLGRYGNPDANALPVPPQPMTAIWTTRPCVRIELSLYSDMGDELLKCVAGGF